MITNTIMRFRLKTCLTSLLFAGLALSSWGNDVPVILTGPGATPLEQLAAREVRRWLAVRPRFRGGKVGQALKWAQRDEALRRGIRRSGGRGCHAHLY